MRRTPLTLAGAAVILTLTAAGCRKTAAVQTGVAADDPASANFAVAAAQPARAKQRLPERVLAERETAPSPQQDGYSDAQSYDNPAAPQNGMYEADQAPPPLPDYAQPVASQPGTVWVPGYWQHGPAGYYWVQGAWVAPPYTGALWTPGYWAAAGPRYRFHPGFWGRHIGYYGGVPYGYGYPGRGYVGGYWSGNRFLLNLAVNHVDGNVFHDVYTHPEPAFSGVRVSYAGPGGIVLPPVPAEMVALHEEHVRPLGIQFDLERRGLHIAVGAPGVAVAPAIAVVSPVVERGPVIVERPVLVEERGGPPGHAYGHYKEHHDNGNHFGEFRDHEDRGNHFGRDEDDRGHGEGHGHGHDR